MFHNCTFSRSKWRGFSVLSLRSCTPDDLCDGHCGSPTTRGVYLLSLSRPVFFCLLLLSVIFFFSFLLLVLVIVFSSSPFFFFFFFSFTSVFLVCFFSFLFYSSSLVFLLSFPIIPYFLPCIFLSHILLHSFLLSLSFLFVYSHFFLLSHFSVSHSFIISFFQLLSSHGIIIFHYYSCYFYIYIFFLLFLLISYKHYFKFSTKRVTIIFIFNDFLVMKVHIFLYFLVIFHPLKKMKSYDR